MSEDSKSFEKKLDRDFLQYLNLTKNLYENVKSEEDRQLCEVWLTHLFGKTVSSVAEKCDRNIYLSRLLIQMQNGKLTGVFLESPPRGSLPCAFTAFGLPTEVDGLKGFEEIGFQIDSSTIGAASGDFFESSRDGRTYLATRHLPQGIMAYLAVTNNEGEPVWIPQTCPNLSKEGSERQDSSEKRPDAFKKILLDSIDVPLGDMRKTPEEREVVFDWMDKMINDCNKWIQGEDPHNMELEQLFTMLYEDYKCDPENAELLKHPRTVRIILYKDIRDRIAERRAEVAKRELILDQYESSQYIEQLKDEEKYIDKVWLDCAKKCIAPSTALKLERTYPPEVVSRFKFLLFQERLIIIRNGEKEVQEKIAELRKASVEETKVELQKLKKAQEEYKEYYSAYIEIEKKFKEFQANETAKVSQIEQNTEKIKDELIFEFQQAKRIFDKEMRTQRDLEEKLEVVKEALKKAKERACLEAEKLNCQANKLREEMDDIQSQISTLKKKNKELQCQLKRS